MRAFQLVSPLVIGLGRSSLLAGLAGYWKLDEASGSRLDSSGLGSTVSETGVTVGSAVGKVGTGASFVRANNSWLRCASNANLQMGDIDFTIAVWVNFGEVTWSQAVFQKFNDVDIWDYELSNDGTDQKLYFYMSLSGGGDVVIGWPNAITVGTWYFVVCIHDSVNNQAKISVNNAAFVTAACSGSPLVSSTGNFSIGAEADPSQAKITGVIDELGIWKKSLSASEITTLYNGGAGKTYPFT